MHTWKNTKSGPGSGPSDWVCSVEWLRCCEFKGFLAQSERTKRPSLSCVRANQICCIRTFQTSSKMNTTSASSQTKHPPKRHKKVNESASSVLLDVHLLLHDLQRDCFVLLTSQCWGCQRAQKSLHTLKAAVITQVSEHRRFSSMCDPERSCLCNTEESSSYDTTLLCTLADTKGSLSRKAD